MLKELTTRIMRRTAAAVSRGPFSGMTITERVVWGNGDIVSRVIGSYEMELWSAIEDVILAKPDAIINVGCAEGYYAVGFALRLPDTVVHAIDVNSKALIACEAAAKANRAEKNIRLEVASTLEIAAPFISRTLRPFILMDCEGAEINILPRLAQAIVDKATFLIECHDFLDRNTTATIVRRLAATHQISIIEEQARDASHFPELSDFDPELTALALSENRPEPMHWIFAKPRIPQHDT